MKPSVPEVGSRIRNRLSLGWIDDLYLFLQLFKEESLTIPHQRGDAYRRNPPLPTRRPIDPLNQPVLIPNPNS
jgi:hypothetical protein